MKNASRILITSVSAVAIAASAALPAFADTNASGNVNISARPGIIMQVNAPTGTAVVPTASNAGMASDVSIDARIAAFTAALARIDAATQVSPKAASSVRGILQAQIARLEALKASGQTTIRTGGAVSNPSGGSNADGTAYFTVMSRAAITAAADRILVVAGQLENLSTKLSVRIDAASNVDSTSLKATLSDMNAKVADAKVQANAALSDVAGLSADADASADTSVGASLKKAAGEIAVARTDIMAAYKDAATIIKAVHGTGPAVSAAASANAR